MNLSAFTPASRAHILHFVGERFGTTPDYPWRTYPSYAVLRHAQSGKWYGLLCDLPAAKIKGQGGEIVEVMNIKCGAEVIDLLLAEVGVYPAWHMNKDHWVSVALAEVAQEAAEEWLVRSFALTMPTGSARGAKYSFR